uniref:Enoyl reductase (ER) domain-containing protein n=1 Tax=Timema tahoe TaxID=61484 RepID=A0A7R9IHD7_9NEOP|nr:unnamed protein product [Timema tahoe]
MMNMVTQTMDAIHDVCESLKSVAGILRVGEWEVPLNKTVGELQPGVYRVTLKEIIVIPSGHEVVLQAAVSADMRDVVYRIQRESPKRKRMVVSFNRLKPYSQVLREPPSITDSEGTDVSENMSPEKHLGLSLLPRSSSLDFSNEGETKTNSPELFVLPRIIPERRYPVRQRKPTGYYLDGLIVECSSGGRLGRRDNNNIGRWGMAYHGMIQTAKLSSGETVLIHAGHTSIGQAAIAFALHIGSTVFTTVREIVHKEFLMKRFPSVWRGTASLIRPIGDDEISEWVIPRITLSLSWNSSSPLSSRQKSTLLDSVHLTRPGPPSWVDRLDVRQQDIQVVCLLNFNIFNFLLFFVHGGIFKWPGSSLSTLWTFTAKFAASVPNEPLELSPDIVLALMCSVALLTTDLRVRGATDPEDLLSFCTRLLWSSSYEHMLKEKNILSLESSFAISLMRATEGKGADVVMNCLRGTHLYVSIDCVADCGRFVQLGTADMEENTNIGNPDIVLALMCSVALLTTDLRVRGATDPEDLLSFCTRLLWSSSYEHMVLRGSTLSNNLLSFCLLSDVAVTFLSSPTLITNYQVVLSLVLQLLLIPDDIVTPILVSISTKWKSRMFVFIRHVTTFGIAEDNLFNAPIAWKKVLHSAIKEGIKSGIIQPLEKIVFPEQQTLEALRELSKCSRVEKVLVNYNSRVYASIVFILACTSPGGYHTQPVHARLIPLTAQMVTHTARVTPGLYHARLVPHTVRIKARNTHCCSHVVSESISVTQLSTSPACYSLLKYLPPKDTFLSHSCHP